MNRICPQCSAGFDSTEEDLAFYEKVSPVFNGKKELIPPPTLCPQCRYRRRMCFRNERSLYHRKCDLTGKSMISVHPANTPFPVYHVTEWLSDAWDPRSYAREYDFNRPFFQQFSDLLREIPHYSAFIDPRLDVNSEYTNCASESKNCYMITQAEKNEDCYYSRGINSSRNCCDCLRVFGCELCYDCISCRNCYGCKYCEDCDNSNDCWFSTDLRGCKNCFGCHGLVQKEYHMFNEPVSKQEWDEKIGALKLSHAIVDQMKSQSAELRLTIPQRASRLIQCEGVSGDDLLNCRNARACFDCRDLEDCAYCNELSNSAKDSMDFSTFGWNCELMYEICGGGYNVYHNLFSLNCWNGVRDLYYCDSCYPAAKDCFGSYGLRQAQYCILNKQYTKEAYEELMPKIIEHMRGTGEWGEYFDPSISAYGYNETVAHDFFPSTKEEVEARGWNWRDEGESAEQYMGPVVPVPETIDTVPDDVTEKILRCDATGKPYRITLQELRLYRTLGVPLPRVSQPVRHAMRSAHRRPRKLWDRACMKCKKAIQTTYAPDRPEIVYCEECYLTSVY